MSTVDVEARFSHRLTELLTGRLNSGTPSWVIEKTKGLKLASGENVLILSGLLASNSHEGEQRELRRRTTSPELGQFDWAPEPPRTSSRRSNRSSVFNRDDYFGYKPVRSSHKISSEDYQLPKEARTSKEYDHFLNTSKRSEKCLSQRMFADTVKRPQLYPLHAGFNGESMHSFIVGSKYNRKNFTSPTHLQLFDYYSPPINPEYIDKKYNGLKSRSSAFRVVSSETELTSHLKSPLPKEVFDLPSSRAPSAASSSRSSTPRRPSTGFYEKKRSLQHISRRLRSAPSYSQISHLQGLSKEVFDKALCKHGSRHMSWMSRPQSGKSISSGSACVICQTPHIWKHFVENQRQVYQKEKPAEVHDENVAEPINMVDAAAQSDLVEIIHPSKEVEVTELLPKVEEETESSMRVFATEPVLDEENDPQPRVMEVEIVVRSRPNSAGHHSVIRHSQSTNDNEDRVITTESFVNETANLPDEVNVGETENDEVFETRHVSSPVPPEE